MASMSTLRDALRDQPPQDFPLKEAWRVLIQALRARRKRGGPAPILAGAAEVERALSRPIPPPEGTRLAAVKRGLRLLLRGDLDEAERDALAGEVEAAVCALSPPPVEGDVVVRISGLPPLMSPADRGRLLGSPWAGVLRLPATEAAALHRRLDGEALGGSVIRVEVELPDGGRLPPVERGARWSPPRSGKPYLPHLDEEGAFSLTPADIAARQAARVRAPVVIDGFAGCGGNAVAFAQAGKRVIAVERDPARARLCRANLGAMGVSARVEVGDIGARLPALLAEEPDAAVFFDPPWGGRDRPLRAFEELRLPPVPADRELHLKLPRELDLATLPAGPWRASFEIAGGVVKMITAQRVRIEPSQPERP